VGTFAERFFQKNTLHLQEPLRAKDTLAKHARPLETFYSQYTLYPEQKKACTSENLPTWVRAKILQDVQIGGCTTLIKTANPTARPDTMMPHIFRHTMSVVSALETFFSKSYHLLGYHKNWRVRRDYQTWHV